MVGQYSEFMYNKLPTSMLSDVKLIDTICFTLMMVILE